MESTHACVLTLRGRVWCWGDDSSGQLGDGRPSSVEQEGRWVRGISGVDRIAVGAQETCALKAGDVYCWGANLGTGNESDRLRPVRVAGLPTATQLVLAGDGVCALVTGKQVYCWGEAGLRASKRPRRVAGLPAVRQLAAGGDHLCVVTVRGAVMCWGRKTQGQLGIPSGQAPNPFNGDRADDDPPPVYGRAAKAPGLVTINGLNAGELELANGVTCARASTTTVECLGNPTVATAGLSTGATWEVDADHAPYEVTTPLSIRLM